MLSRFNRSIFTNGKYPEAIRTFNKTGAIIWNEPIVTSDSTLDKWNCASTEVTLHRNFPDKNDKFTVSKELAQLLKDLVPKHNYKSVLRGMTGVVKRRIPPKINNQSLDNTFHVDTFNSITLIIPLTEFTINNGSTQLLLSGELVHFIGPPFEPLIMDGEILHRQSANLTDSNRDALVLQIDQAAFLNE